MDYMYNILQRWKLECLKWKRIHRMGLAEVRCGRRNDWVNLKTKGGTSPNKLQNKEKIEEKNVKQLSSV